MEIVEFMKEDQLSMMLNSLEHCDIPETAGLENENKLSLVLHLLECHNTSAME